jgi:threonine dehydratase
VVDEVILVSNDEICAASKDIWAYLMKVISETSREHWIWYLRFF